jgi:hypothetical protein
MNPNEHEPYFLVELRSLGGHSGSPVFIYDVPYHWGSVRKRSESYNWFLLGVNSGHIFDYSPIVSFTADGKDIVKGPKWLQENHIAMALVRPAWHLNALLNHDIFKQARERAVEEAMEKKVGHFRNDKAKPSASQKSKRGQ